MKRSKLIFLVLSIIFFIVLILIILDISRKTTFPGGERNKDSSSGIIIPVKNQNYIYT